MKQFKNQFINSTWQKNLHPVAPWWGSEININFARPLFWNFGPPTPVFQRKRDIQLMPRKCFNQWLLNYSKKFASDSDYIFFAWAVLLKIQLNYQISVVMSNVTFDSLTAGLLSKHFKDTVRQVAVSDKAYSFVHLVRGT